MPGLSPALRMGIRLPGSTLVGPGNFIGHSGLGNPSCHFASDGFEGSLVWTYEPVSMVRLVMDAIDEVQSRDYAGDSEMVTLFETTADRSIR